MRTILLIVALALAAFARTAGAVGFQEVTVPDPDDKPLAAAIWYPSSASTAPRSFGLLPMAVAENAPVSGDHLPLVVISHGTGGSDAGHSDTAIALAEAGFVVAAVTHTGDNPLDHSYAFTARNFAGRPRHLSQLIDYMLASWPEHARIDPARIGAFGHSAGGFTVLIAAGGVADFARAPQFCADHPEAWECRQAKQVHDLNAPPDGPTTIGPVRDARIKAAVVAAPAVVYTFPAQGLTGIPIPVQVWSAGKDVIAPPQWNADILRTALRSPDFHAEPEAGHFSFLPPCSEELAKVKGEICEDPPGFDRAAFHRDFNRTVVAFFSTHLPPRR
ncbi:MAG: prolyl oligopeptidase family serine peptidase [Alphaproteobacteria bacterium]|nr:prolyl oligopeptidase family serine peptidase [Alphaproteobacteria bacterium]